MTDEKIEELCINTIRFLSVDAVEAAKSGHPGLPMEAAAMGYKLFTQILRHNPSNPKWTNRDRFVLSSGHGSMILYSLLHLCGYDLALDEIKKFRQIGSKAPGHPEYGETQGVETTTGPLGQGFSAGIGMAFAQRYLANRFNTKNHKIIDHKIYVFCSDGDLMEGISSEAAAVAGHQKFNNLIYVYLDNHISIDGNTELTTKEDIKKRFEAHGWFVQKIEGNNLQDFSEAIKNSQEQEEKPSLIIARTHIGFGSPNKQDSEAAHGAPLGPDETKLTKENLGWPLEPTFYIPDEVKQEFQKVVTNGNDYERRWNEIYESYKNDNKELAEEFEDLIIGKLPENWDKNIPIFNLDESLATRQASGKTLNILAENIPAIIGGSADLMDSTNVRIKTSVDSLPEAPHGRNIHFGIREHAMGAILHGMAAYGGVIPFGSTFLIFSDYMRGSVRLASLMGLQIIFIYTHDSIGVGEDGPTHQPIEQVSNLRAVPNLTVIRPGDANETVVAWKTALQITSGPTALILTRQAVPVLYGESNKNVISSPENLRKGGYTLVDSNGLPELIIIATGSELHLAVEAQKELKNKGVNVRVVSMPSWELFEKQSDDYKEQVLPIAVKKRVSVEAASTFGWERYIGLEGKAIGMVTFGISAPGNEVMKKFGFTVDNVVNKSLELLKK
ncbi:MAG: transketolase [Thaumarchaeota archaeon]|nr:transketolase [Nitrososphaerota archaeon]